MATENLDPAVKEEDYLSLKVEDDDGDFLDDYSNKSLAGLATISKHTGLVRDEAYQRCAEPKKAHGSQCSKPNSPPRRPDTEADLFAVGGMTRKHFVSAVASCMTYATLDFSRAHKHLTHSFANLRLKDQAY